jgi:hypothetical protein
MNILSLPAPLALVQVWTDNNFLPLFKQEEEEDSLVVMSGTRVKFDDLGGRGRGEGGKRHQKRRFLWKTPTSWLPRRFSPVGNSRRSLEVSLSLSQVPRDPRRSPGSPEPDTTCQETGREQDSISPTHMGTSNG